jgi:hypothetical protein
LKLARYIHLNAVGQLNRLSKGYVVIEWRLSTRAMSVVARATAFGFRRHSRSAAATEKSNPLCNDFGHIPFVTALVVVASSADAALDKNLPAFGEILAARFTLLTPDNDVMPFGSFLLVAVTVIPNFGRSDGKTRDRATGRGEAKFRIFTEITDENHFVNRH